MHRCLWVGAPVHSRAPPPPSPLLPSLLSQLVGAESPTRAVRASCRPRRPGADAPPEGGGVTGPGPGVPSRVRRDPLSQACRPLGRRRPPSHTPPESGEGDGVGRPPDTSEEGRGTATGRGRAASRVGSHGVGRTTCSGGPQRGCHSGVCRLVCWPKSSRRLPMALGRVVATRGRVWRRRGGGGLLSRRGQWGACVARSHGSGEQCREWG